MTDVITMTAREADAWRTAAAVIHNAVNGNCGDIRPLMIREDDPDYPRDAARNVMSALYFNAVARGVVDSRIVKARELVMSSHGRVNEHLAIDLAHFAAHQLATILRAAIGDEATCAQSQFMVDHFAVGDFGPDVKVE